MSAAPRPRPAPSRRLAAGSSPRAWSHPSWAAGRQREGWTDPARRAERRRRERHFRLRRRDLLLDTGIALLVAIILLTVTAGLGIVALIVVPVAGGLILSRVVARLRARRRERPVGGRPGVGRGTADQR